MDKTTRCESALRDIEAGYGVTPLNGKRPIRQGWQDHPIRDESRWNGYAGNHGIVLTPEDRVLVVDVDVKSEGENGADPLQEWVKRTGLDLSRYPSQRTPSGGAHVIGRIPADYPAGTLPNGAAVPGVDVLRKDRQFVRAPGQTDSGEYEEITPLLPLADLPEWPADFLDVIREDAGSSAGTEGSPAPEQGELRAPDVDTLAEVVSRIPNRGPAFEPRDAYIRVGAAIKAAAGPGNEGEALDLFQRWAARWEDGENDPATVRKDFEGLHPPHQVGFPYLTDLAGDRTPLATSEFEADQTPSEADRQASDNRKQNDIEVKVMTMDNAEAENIRWLWPGYIPFGKTTVMAGLPGLGKSVITIDLAARLSRNDPMPDGVDPNVDGPAGVVLLTAEDDPADTLKPRLIAAGADPSRIAHVDRVRDRGRERFIRVDDIEAIRQAVEVVDAKMVVVDPLMSFIGSSDSVDAYRDQDVRDALMPLSDLASEMGFALILVSHPAKGAGSNSAVYYAGESKGIMGAARAGLIVTKYPKAGEGVRAVAPSKANLSEEKPALIYRTVGRNVTVKGEVHDYPVIHWRGTEDISADALLALNKKTSQPSPATDAAVVFLSQELREHGGSLPSDELYDRARQAGHRRGTLRRAKEKLGVESRRIGGAADEGHWVWSLPENEDTTFDADKDAPDLSSVGADGQGEAGD